MDAPQNSPDERSEEVEEDSKNPSTAELLEPQDSRDQKQAEALEETKDSGNATMQEPQDSPDQKRNEDPGYGLHRFESPVSRSQMFSDVLSSIKTAARSVHEGKDPAQLIFGFALACLVLLVVYVMYSANHINAYRAKIDRQRLQEAIDQFPKNPIDYNVMQRTNFLKSREDWRRYNFRAIGILVMSGTIGMALTIWHRRRRATILKRKSLFFWLYTMAAAFSMTFWGAYLMNKRTPTQKILRNVQRNPVMRAVIYLSAISVIGLILLFVRIAMDKRKRNRRRQFDSEGTTTITL